MKRNTKLIISTFGLVVESVPTKHGSRVRFPEGAFFFPFIQLLIKFNSFNIWKRISKYANFY